MPAAPDQKGVLILGATGPLGLLTAKEALSKDFKVTLYLRNPLKLSKEIKDDKNVTVSSHTCLHSQQTPPDAEDIWQILVGTLTEAPKILFPHLPSFTTIISAMGPLTSFSETYIGTPIADFYAALLQHLSSLPKSQPRPYVLALATPSQPDQKDSFSLLFRILMFFFRRLFWSQYNEVRAIASAFLKYGEGIPWTLYRVGNLTNGDGMGVANAGYVGDSAWRFRTSRVDIAKWIVTQMELDEAERKWVGKMPAISGS
jgi:hypothetical protein